MEEKRVFSKRFLNINFTIFTVVLVTFLIISAFKSKDGFEAIECEKIGFSGSYSFDGVTFSTIDENTEFGPIRQNYLVLKGHFDRDIADGKPVFLYLNGIKAKVYINGEEVFSRTNADANPWEYIYPINLSTSDEVEFVLETEAKYHVNMYFAKFYSGIYHGSRYDMVAYMLKSDVVSIVLSLIVIVMGAGMFIYKISFGHDAYQDEGMVSCGTLLFAGGFASLVNYGYATLLFGSGFAMKQVDQMNQILMCMFLLAYIKKYLTKEASRNINDVMVVCMTAFAVLFMVKCMVMPSQRNFDPVFICAMGFVAFLLCIELIALYRNSKEKDRKRRIAFESLIVLIVSFLVEMAYFMLTGTYFAKLFEVALFLFSVLHYYLLLSSNIENYRKAKKTTELEHELSQNKIKLVMSQIQPHFLFNAIATIRALCIRNPEEARNGLDYFAKYLRANMDSLGENGCIPFEKELDHTKSYLYIEKLRFGEMLEIQYDIQVADFMVPPLSLQPMVENAVKHGLLAQKDGGVLKISTRETEYIYEIKIEDNGVGFDLTKPLESNRSHVGIMNARQRVAALCDGTLNVVSKVGAGTVITITIPKQIPGDN